MANKGNTFKRILIGLVGVILLFSIGSMLLIKTVYDRHFPRAEALNNTGYLTYNDVPGTYGRTKVEFESGKNTLTGYIYGESNTKGLVVIAHGLGFGAEDYLAETLYFVDHGWRVLIYDCTGTHESEGKNTAGLPQSLLDLDAALRFVESDPALNTLPVVLYGHSWGGYAVTAILNYDHDIRAATSIAGFNVAQELLTEQVVAMFGAFGYLEAPYGRVYQNLLFGSTAGVTAVDGINHGDTPVMIIHGTADESIPYDGASILAHRDEITNPNVIYKTSSVEGHNGHNNLVESEAASAYIAEMNRVYQELHDRYEGSIPDDVKAQYYAGIDRFRTSELNTDFMDEINRFFEEAVTYTGG